MADDGQDDVLGCDAGGQLAFDGDAEGLRLVLRQGLGGQHMLHFAGANAECQRAKRAVRRGVRVAADNGHARLGDAQFRPNHVHDALLARVHVVELDAKVGAIVAQRSDLRGGDLVENVQAAFNRGRHIVVHRSDRAIRAAHLAAGQPQAFKCLRRSHFMQQLQVDVEQRGLAFGLNHHMLLPDFFKQRFWQGTHWAPGLHLSC